MGRSPCCDESGLKKGPWTPEEDDKLIKYIQKHGHGSWRALPKLAGLNRCGKSCRLRWTNYLRPDIKRGKFSEDEEQTILNLHAILGNKWSAIATPLPGRTDNEIKNFWNTHLKKKLIQMGFDPMTHRPRTDIFSSLPHLIALANLKELIENPSWEEQAMRLQAEAVQMARLNQYVQCLLQPAAPSMAPVSSTFQNINPNLPDMAAFNLFNSLKLDTSILTHLEAPPAPVPSLSASDFLQAESMSFSHLPDLQAPCEGGAGPAQGSDFAAAVLSHGDHSNSPGSASSSWMQTNILSPSAAAQVTDASVSNTVDACSTSSSYGGTAQMWSELLDDPIFHEIA